MRPEQKQAQDKNGLKVVGFLAGLLALVGVFAAGVALGERGEVGFSASNLTDRLSSSQSRDNSGELPNDLNYDEVEELYDILRRNYDGDLSEQAFLDSLKQGLAEATGDPYTEFFNASAAEAFTAELDGTFTGIGAELGKDDDRLIVVSPLNGYPAEAAGLQPRDVIAQIDGEDSTDFSVFEAVSKIRGEEGTDVTLTIVRDQTEVLEITITRALIDVPSVTYEIDGDLGIITIGQFSDDTTDLVKEAADEFLRANVAGVVLDLRGNPGGFLDEAITVSGVWLDSSKEVVEVKSGGQTEELSFAEGDAELEGVPTVVIINEGSASASEIVAGALKDNGAATVIGLQSFGKGSVQNLRELGGGELIKITTARWFTPNDVSIDQEGIAPDEVVEVGEEQFEAGEDPQLDRAKEILR